MHTEMKLWTAEHAWNLQLFSISCRGSDASARCEALTGEKSWVLTHFIAVGRDDRM
jgi:hypothetical protein